MTPYQISRIRWQGIKIEIRYTPDWGGGYTAHLELQSIPKRTPLPVTETGYRSYFHPQGIVEEAGGAEAFVTAWLDHEARKPAWRAQQDAGRQLSLF